MYGWLGTGTRYAKTSNFGAMVLRRNRRLVRVELLSSIRDMIPISITNIQLLLRPISYMLLWSKEHGV